MDSSYQHQHHQPYHQLYEQPQWSEDFKPHLSEHNQDHSRERASSISVPTSDFTSHPHPHPHRPSMLKTEDDYSPDEHMWHERRQGSELSMRHYSQQAIPLSHPHVQHPPFVRETYVASYGHPPSQWPISQSGTNTPTPVHSSIDSYGRPVQYATYPNFNFNQDPISAISMSPQSSQGGWASATSTESAEQRGVLLQSPIYRPVSPQLVLRPDGIRKKNARFEIPKERNLQTIDALIQASTDDNEKKELKQQKRLLRNRQAALDSRQRKKTHTEKLEHEKKISEKRMVDLKDAYTRMQEALQIEREQWMHQRQQYELQAKQLMHDRDEAIKAKTVEAADYRRQVNILKDYIRDHHMERPTRVGGYAPASEMNTMATEFSEFNFDDSWGSEFSLIGSEDYRMDELDSMQRQATPKPPTSNQTTAVASVSVDKNFSWNAFYMCLLFGAVVISAGEQLTKLAPKSSQISQLPKITDEYRVDAQNVLKAVMDTDHSSAFGMIPTRSAASSASKITTFNQDFSDNAHGSVHESELDRLASTLTTPSHEQKLRQVFSMTAESYNNISDPLGEFADDDDADADLPDSPKPTRLEQAFAALQERQSESEISVGLRSKADERSVLLDNVPEHVIRDFKEFVRQSKANE